MFRSDLLIHDIVQQLLTGNQTLCKSAANFVKIHTGNQLAVQGDMSFPLLAKQWALVNTGPECGATIFNHFQNDGYLTTEESLIKLVNNLQPFVSRMKIHQNRVMVFLERCAVFASIEQVISDGEDYGRRTNDNLRSVIMIRDEWEDIGDAEMLERNVSDYRCRLVRDVLKNIIGYSSSGTRQDDRRDRPAAVRWLVTNKTNQGGTLESVRDRVIFCGVLRGAGQTGKKKTDISTEKYFG